MFEVQSLPRKLDAALTDAKAAKARVRISALRDLIQYAQWENGGPARMALEEGLSDVEPEVRGAACLALADALGGAPQTMRQTTLLDSIQMRLSDANAKVRQMALLALGELASPGNAQVSVAIRPFLYATDPALRFQALHAFVQVETSANTALEILVNACEDQDAEIRYLALRLLQQKTGRAQPDVKQLDPEEPLPLPVAEHAFRQALTDDVFKVQLAAAIALPASSTDPLVKLHLVQAAGMARSSKLDEDIAHAIDRCGELHLKEAIPALERRAFGKWYKDPFAFQARIALARMAHSKARASIVADLSAWSRDRRQQAVVSAGLARIEEAKPYLERLRGSVDGNVLERALAQIGHASTECLYDVDLTHDPTPR